MLDKNYSDGQHRRTVTNRKLMSRYPDFRFTPLAEAIKASVAWFQANRETARL